MGQHTTSSSKKLRVFDTCKLVIENWKTILGIVALLGSLGGNAVQGKIQADKDEQIGFLASSYRAVVYQQYKHKAPPTTIQKTIIQQEDCATCERLEATLDEHIKQYDLHMRRFH